jgi:tetratricopeptide (TPR) repeat protein
MKPHAFIAMPFGTKPGHDGAPIDFDRVYAELIRPALEEAGCEVFRADEEQRAGDIRTDMFQELLVADLVVADLTLDNPNVWYELGVRHALRARGVVLMQGPRPNQPFDIYTDRKLRYSLKDGAPDPATLAQDRARLAAMARETLDASTARKVSPVYVLLEHLREPQWRDLLLAERNEFSEAYEAWASRLEVARQKNRPGDILVLADETPTRALQLEARRAAGNSLIKVRHFDLALEQFEAALAIHPDDKPSREKKAVCLGRLGRYEEAREWTRQLTEDYPKDAEVWSLAGRVEKDNWIQRWRQADGTPAQMREAAAAEQASLEEAIAPYHQAFIADPSHFYSGTNSLTLHLLLEHLGGAPDKTVVNNLIGGVLWASLTAQERDKKDYWARASYAELCLLVNPKDTVIREYRTAVAAANRDWFALDSSRQTLELLRDLEFRAEETAAALAIVDADIKRATPPFEPRQVLLFSGHMLDAPGRDPPRLPADKEAAAAEHIAQALDAAGAGAGDLALCQAAAGGDLLFLEACQARGVRCQVLLPFAEPQFIEQSVLPAQNGERWRERYFALKTHLADLPRIMPAELGPLPKDVNPYERCNLWLLYTALAWGVEKVRFCCLWNGGGGDGPGGTAHLYNEVKRRTGRVTWIDTRTL